MKAVAREWLSGSFSTLATIPSSNCVLPDPATQSMTLTAPVRDCRTSLWLAEKFQGQGTFCGSNSLLSLTHGAQSHLQRPRYSLLISRVRTSYLQKASQGNVPQGR